jgi:hypothetical protein
MPGEIGPLAAARAELPQSDLLERHDDVEVHYVAERGSGLLLNPRRETNTAIRVLALLPQEQPVWPTQARHPP